MRHVGLGLATTLPIADPVFAMLKGELMSALCVRFGWKVPNLSQACVSGKSITV